MLGCRGRVQRASGVIHLIVESVSDLTADLKKVSANLFSRSRGTFMCLICISIR
jgi:hypothetical protein